MKWLEATAIVLLAALATVFVFWFLPLGLVFVVGLVTLVFQASGMRDRNRRRLLERPRDLRRADDDLTESTNPVHRGSGLGAWMRR